MKGALIQMHNSLQYAHELIKKRVQPGDLVVDATAGNGHDTLLLAELVGAKGMVLSYDIQSSAIENTRAKVEAAGLLSRVQLFERGHETMEQELQATSAQNRQVKAVMFNTGYLPGGDHAKITQAETTLRALDIAHAYLAPRGLITIVSYYGHPGGAAELASLMEYLQNLDQREFDVLEYRFINQRNEPPILFVIEKKVGKILSKEYFLK